MTAELCPICGDEKRQKEMVCKDHSTSGEAFEIVSCSGCGLWYTDPRPTEDKIGDYYKSETYISHTSSTKGLMNKVYHWVRRRTLKNKERLLRTAVPMGRVLDVGCGTGDFLAHCKSLGWDIKGLEPDDDARKMAIQKGLDIAHTKALHEGELGRFKAITLWHVLEHVYDLKKDFAKMLDLLEDQGVMMVAVPNRSSHDAQHYGEYWAAYDVPIHLYHFTPNDIENLCKENGARLERMEPMKWDAFYVSMLSEGYRGRNKWLGLWRGWRSNIKARNGKYSSQIYVIRKSAV